MQEQRHRLYRVFSLIRYLNTPPPRTAKQLISILQSDKSTFYRDIKLIESLGYPVDSDEKHRWFIQFQFPKSGKNLLSADELLFLQEQLQQVPFNSPQIQLAQRLLQKLDRNQSLIPLADVLPVMHKNRIIQLIRTAIEGEYCLKIKGYRSLTSLTVSDRRVEPLELTQDFRYLIAWDLDKKDQRQFKLDRISDIDLLDQKITPGRASSPMDLFGLTGTEWMTVRLKLSATAHHLLVEEFPLSRQYISRKGKEVYFEGMVRNWKGIGRFVLGIPGEIEVIAPASFKQYLKERIAQFGQLR